MNPLMQLNKTHTRSRHLRIWTAFVLVAGIFGGAWWKQTHPEPVSFEVAYKDALAEVAAAEAKATEPTKEVESVTQAPVPEAPKFQVMTIRPYSKTFAEGREPYAKQVMAYTSDTPSVRSMVLPPVIVQRPHETQKLAVEKPKHKHEARLKVAPPSDNWGQMSGSERWKFVAAYVRSMHWKCPPSGLSRANEIAKLSPSYVTWGMVRNMGLNNCVAATTEQAGR